MFSGGPHKWFGLPQVYTYDYGLHPAQQLSFPRALLAVILAVLVISPLYIILQYKSDNLIAYQPDFHLTARAQALPASTPPPASTAPAVTAPQINQKMQSMLDSWTASHPGQAWGVAVQSGDGRWTAGANADQEFTSESLYKLFVAYLGYQMIDNGTYGGNQPYLNSWTRQQCLDQMIRNSNSPCAEKMMAELGKPAIDRMISSYDLTHTSMTRLTTSASDVTALLARLQAGRDLSSASQRKFMDSLLGQKYRWALPTGFAPLKVYDKVGFRGYDIYNDAAIVILPGDKPLIVTVMTRNASTREIARLAPLIAKNAHMF